MISRLTRRSFLKNWATAAALIGSSAVKPSETWGQGVASGGLGPGAPPKAGPPVANFVDIAHQAGLTARTHIGGLRTKEFILESTGGGVALFDYDNDGWLDIFLVNGWRREGFRGTQESTNHLYHNNHDGTFTDVTRKAGLARGGWGQGSCVGDYDNDGFLDLFVTYYGQNVLYHNNGDGTFSDVTRASGLHTGDDRYSTGAAFLDYDRDGQLDLFIAHYTAYSEAQRYGHGSGQNCAWRGLPVFCGPRGLQGTTNSLYWNNGNKSFEDVSEKAGLARTGYHYGFTPLVLDYDNDGWPDIYVADDSTASLLFHNNHDGTFTEAGVLAGVAYNEDGREQAGMGVAAADYDRDGWLDIIKTNFVDDTSTLYHNQHDGTFDDVTFAAGLGNNTQFLGWGTAFLDFDNDGWPDLLIANGHVYPEVDTAPLDTPYKERKILYLNKRNGAFEDVSLRGGPGILVSKAARGAAFGDLFNTGQTDIVINNMNDSPTLLRNLMPTSNHALTLQLVGTKTNRSAIGARVTVQIPELRMIDEVRSGGSFCSQNDLRLHFGLGPYQKADAVEIQWPSGLREVVKNVEADRVVVLKEGAGIVNAFKFFPSPKF